MRVLFLYLLLATLGFAEDRYFLDVKILSNFLKININNNDINWVEKGVIADGFVRLEITNILNQNTNKQFSIYFDSNSVADLNNDFGYWIYIYKNNNMIFKDYQLTKTIQIDQKNIREFSIDK